jgi:uncharacterized protein YkwD
VNWVDLIIILALVWFTLVGYWRGFIRQGLDLVVFVLAILLALGFYHTLAQFFVSSFHIANGFSNAIAFFSIWFIVEVIYYILFVMFYDRIPEEVRESDWNSYLGFLPAFFRGVLIIWLFLSLFLILPIPAKTKDHITGSFIGGPIVKTSPVVEGYIEKVFGQSLNDTITFLTVKPQSDETVNLEFKVANPSVCATDEVRMLDLVNIERTTRGLKPLTMNDKLRIVARSHSKDMFQRGYFAHNTPEGLTPFDRMDNAKIKYSQAGENLALAPDVEIAHNGLMNSPGHRANILTPEFKRIGIGCMSGGTYGKMFSQEFTN